MHLNELLAKLIEQKGHVLHLAGGSPPLMLVQTGKLSPLLNEPFSAAEVKNLLEEALTEEQKKILHESKEMGVGYGVEGVGRFRVSIFYQRNSLAAVFRLTPSSPPSLDTLGLPPLLKEFIAKPQGLILIAGPKASGKSQTLASILDHLLDSGSLQIVTIESPIEYLLKNKKGIIYQRELGTDATTYQTALQTALRQNPDVLAVSELPDFESIGTLFSAATSGTLVIATINANGMVRAMEQIVELSPPHSQSALKNQLASAFEFGISQLLITTKQSKIVLVNEVLVGTPQVKGLLRDGKLDFLINAMNNGREAGMVSQELTLKMLCKKSTIELEDALGKAARPDELKRLMTLPI